MDLHQSVWLMKLIKLGKDYMITGKRDLLLLVCFIILMLSYSTGKSQESEDDTLLDSLDESEYQIQTLVLTITEFDNLSKFYELLNFSGLIEKINDSTTFTLLIPEDSAFIRLPSETMEKLMTDKKYLRTVLSRHIIKGKVIEFGYQETTIKLKSLNGDILNAEVTLESVSIDQAWVIEEDIECSNGVIHIIDNVLLPPEG